MMVQQAMSDVAKLNCLRLWGTYDQESFIVPSSKLLPCCDVVPETTDAITTKRGHLAHASIKVNIQTDEDGIAAVPSIEGFKSPFTLRGEDAHKMLEDTFPDT